MKKFILGFVFSVIFLNKSCSGGESSKMVVYGKREGSTIIAVTLEEVRINKVAV